MHRRDHARPHRTADRLARLVAFAVALVVLVPAAATALPIEDYARYEPQTNCSPNAKPGTLRLSQWLQKTYPGSGSLGISRSCKDGGVLLAGTLVGFEDPPRLRTTMHFLLAAFNLRQPDPASPEVAPDVILTPLVGFDRRLNRLGQGAGHYDRAFARYEHAWRVGIAWSVQEVPAIPADIWDVPLHAIITEEGMLWHAEK